MDTTLRIACVLISCLVLDSGLGLVQAQGKKAARSDQYGDPLPRGAIARLGTLRLVHLGGISSVAVSPDGKIVASGVRDGKGVYLGKEVMHKSGAFTVGSGVWVTHATIRLWDSATGKLIREIRTPDAPVSSLYFAPDGRTLFAGCGKFLCSWDVSTGKKLWHAEGIKGARFHYGIHATKILLANDKIISLHGGRIICPDGASYFYHPQKAIRIWNSKTGTSIPIPKALESTVHAETRIASLFHEVVIAPDGRHAALLVSRADPKPRKEGEYESKWKYTNRRLEIIEISTGKVVYSVPDRTGTIKLLTFSEDGKTLAIATTKEIRLVKTATGKKRLLINDLPSWVADLAFMEKTKLAAQLGNDSICVWNITSGKRIEKHGASERSFDFESAKSAQVVATDHGNTVRLVDLKSGQAIHSFDGHRLTPLVRYALFSNYTLLSRDAQRLFRWETRSWKINDSDIPGNRLGYWWYPIQRGEMDQVVSVEQGLYVKDSKKRAELRDLKTDKLISVLQASDGKGVGYGGSFYFSAAGNRLVIPNEFFHFFDVRTGKRLSQVPNPMSNVIRLGYNNPELSPHGNLFAKNDKGAQIDLYDVRSGKIIRSVVPKFRGKNENSGNILRFHFSRDEKLLFGEVHEQIGFENGFSENRVTVTLWDTSSGKVIQEMVLLPKTYVFWRRSLSKSAVSVLTLSHDHRLVALAKNGKTIDIWETASGTKRGQLIGHDGTIADLAFSADNRQLASSSEDTTILIWDLNRPLQPGRFKKRLLSTELAAHWKTLGQRDAQKADTAIWSLVYAAKDSLPFLRKHLKPVVVPPEPHVRGLLDALDSKRFKIRFQAQAELESFGELVLDKLLFACKQNNTLEKQLRLEKLLHKAQQAALPFATPKRVQQWRALEVLERIGSKDAKQLLRDLTKGALDAQLTKTARKVLARMDSQRNWK